jgi:hypothetical protein
MDVFVKPVAVKISVRHYADVFTRNPLSAFHEGNDATHFIGLEWIRSLSALVLSTAFIGRFRCLKKTTPFPEQPDISIGNTVATYEAIREIR